MNEYRYMNPKNYFLKNGFDEKSASEKTLKIMERDITIRTTRTKRRVKHLSVREIRIQKEKF